MTFNVVIALILRFFTEFGSFAGQLRHTGSRWCPPHIVSQFQSSTFGQI